MAEKGTAKKVSFIKKKKKQNKIKQKAWQTLSQSNFQNQKFEEEGTLQNAFYKANITLMPKPDKDTARKENYRTISLINTHVKILNKILGNQINNTLKESYDMIKIYP